MEESKIESVQDLLIQYLEKEVSHEELIKQISFELKYNDPLLKGELTTPYIEMLSGYQESAYLAYLLITGRSENLVFLTDKEKEALSLKFKIEEGSNIIESALENADNFQDLIEVGVNKMDGAQILILVAIIAGYLSLKKIADLIESIKTKKIEVDVSLANVEREKQLYNTFENMQKNLLNSKFDQLKQDSIHKPLYAYENNCLITKEETTTSEQALEMKINPIIATETIEEVVMVDGVKGASENGSHTTFWLIDKNSREFSIQLKSNDLDIARKGLLFKNMGKHIYIELEITRKDGVIKSKKINEIFSKETHPEKFV